uniref:En/Spm-like transposon protein n=1 Tax=Arabidopsis thaliana TaxID=3702 RepID=Q9SHS4_ARATH|nr:En/Spm-like transposon protein [Arabidopsis thaliana]AAP21691.1 hypothetical protein [Arabidopsis thaliana]AAV63865.1 hypothetical protein [Arabidopsis thaliana]
MKDMVSTISTSRECPKWIIDSHIWKAMCEYWDTEEAIARSKIYSKARLSDRNGLGPHIHLSGPKSYQNIKHELEKELGRRVTVGEVFIKTHTKPDGTYVDKKAEQIVKNYEKKLQEKLSEMEAETSNVSDGESRPRELTIEDHTVIFLEVTETDTRGNYYGVGSLKDNLPDIVTGKGKHADSTSFVSLQEQLKEAQQKIEEQAAHNARREEEQVRAVAKQKDKLEHLALVEKYLRQTDPAFLNFMATQSSEATITDPI